MRYGLPLSLLFHGLVLAAVLIGWPVSSKPIAEKSVEIPVEIVRFDETSNPPPGRKEDQRDDRKPDADRTEAERRAADGGKTRPITRPEKAPEQPAEKEVPKPAGAPDKKPETPAAERPDDAPKTPEKPPELPKPEVKKPNETPDPSTPKTERELATPSRPSAPPAPPQPEVRKPSQTPDSATPKTEREAAPKRPEAPPKQPSVTVPTPKSPDKAPATPDSDRRRTEAKKPPAPPEPERHEAALRPPPKVTEPDSTKPDTPDAQPEASQPKKPAPPPKPPERQTTLRPPPPADPRAPAEPKEPPQVKTQPQYRPERGEPDKKDEEKPGIKSRPQYRAEKKPPEPRDDKAKQPPQTPSKMDSIFRNLDRERKAPRQADADRTARDQRQGAPQHRPSAPLSQSEIDAIKRQIRPCWSADAAAKDLGDLVVVIEVWMNEDGTVRDARVSSETRIRGAAHRAAADRALRAVLNERCQPFRLPRDKYERWKYMKLEFDPSDV